MDFLPSMAGPPFLSVGTPDSIAFEEGFVAHRLSKETLSDFILNNSKGARLGTVFRNVLRLEDDNL